MRNLEAKVFSKILETGWKIHLRLKFWESQTKPKELFQTSFINSIKWWKPLEDVWEAKWEKWMMGEGSLAGLADPANPFSCIGSCCSLSQCLLTVCCSAIKPWNHAAKSRKLGRKRRERRARKWRKAKKERELRKRREENVENFKKCSSFFLPFFFKFYHLVIY